MIHERHMPDDPEYAREYEALEEEFACMKKVILARKRAGASNIVPGDGGRHKIGIGAGKRFLQNKNG